MIDDGARELIEQQSAEIAKLKSALFTLIESDMDTQGAIDELFGWQQSFRASDYVSTEDPRNTLETADGSVIIDTGEGFSGVAYVVGQKVTGLNSNPDYPWVKVVLNSGTLTDLAVEDPGPPSNPFPQNEEWYEKAKVSGDIHVPRF
jgi:hypothetical protein